MKVPSTVAYFTVSQRARVNFYADAAEKHVARYLYNGFAVVGTEYTTIGESVHGGRWTTLVRYEPLDGIDRGTSPVDYQIGRLTTGPFQISEPVYLTREEAE